MYRCTEKRVALPLASRLATDFDLIRGWYRRSVPSWSRGFNWRARRARFRTQGLNFPEKRSPPAHLCTRASPALRSYQSSADAAAAAHIYLGRYVPIIMRSTGRYYYYYYDCHYYYYCRYYIATIRVLHNILYHIYAVGGFIIILYYTSS